MKKLTGSACSLIVVIVLMLAVISLSQKLEYSASKLLPLIIGGFVLILAIIALITEFLSGSSQDTSTERVKATTEEKDADNRRKVYLEMGGWLFGYAIAIYLFGFMISTPVFVGAYMKRHGSGWPSVVITAGIFSVIFYTVFNVALQADLYSGRLLMWLG